MTVTNNGFTMPDNDVTLKAVFEENPPGEHSITVTNDGHGTGTASAASAVSGTQITLTPHPGSGYHFKEWQVISGGVTVSNNGFTMSDEDVVVKAIFEADSTPAPAPTDPTNPYQVTDIPGGVETPTWTRGSGDFTFTIEGDATHDPFANFESVRVGDKTLEEGTDFTKKEGSLILTIKSSALSKLTNGDHRLTVRFNDGQERLFTLNVKPASYSDGDGGDSTSSPTTVTGNDKKAPKMGEV